MHTPSFMHPDASGKPSERSGFVFFLLWSIWLGAEYWIFGPLSYVRIHDTASTYLSCILTWADSWRSLWGSTTMGWLCSIDRMSNVGWWSNFTLPFMILPPWLAFGLLMTLQRLVASYFTYRLMRDRLGGTVLVSVAAGCVYSLLHTDLGEVTFMHGLNEPGVPLLLWFFWRLPLNRLLPVLGWSFLMGIVVGWGMSFIIGTAFILPVIWLALQAGRSDFDGWRSRLVLTAGLGVFWAVSLYPRLPEIWALGLVAPDSARAAFRGQSTIVWSRIAVRQFKYILAWWPFFAGILLWLSGVRWRRPQDRVIAVFLAMGLVVAPLTDPLRGWLSPWLGFLRGVDFKRFQIVAPMALSLALFCGLTRWSTWRGALCDNRGRMRLQLSLSEILAGLIWLLAAGRSVEVKAGHWRLQRYEGYNWSAIFGNDDLKAYARQARNEELRFATAGAHARLHAGFMMAYGAETADGHTGLYGMRYYQFWSKVIQPLMERDREIRGFHQWGQYVYLHHARSGSDYDVREIPFRNWYNLDLLSLAGVGYLMSEKPIADGRLHELPMPMYTQRIGEWSELPTQIKIRRYLQGRNPGRKLYVYRNEAALPRHFLVPGLRTFADADALWEAMGEAALEELTSRVFVVESEAPTRSELGTTQDGGAHIAVLDRTPGRHRLQVHLDSPCVLVVTDQYYPWWEWRVNGHQITAFPAYGVFQGIMLPPGENLVEGVYRPPYQVLLRPGSLAL